MLEIRSEVVGDRLAIVEVHASAFSTDAEARLVDALRAGGKASVSLVAELEGAVGADEEFMVLELRPGALSGVPGLVKYAPEFAAVEA